MTKLTSSTNRSSAVKYGLLLLTASAIVLAFIVLPINRWALLLVEWMRGAGSAGAAVYALVYVAATLLLLPGSVLTAGAGFVYGPIWGTLLVSPISVAAATLAFAVGRSFARGWVARRTAGHPRFTAIDEAIGQSGFKIIVLLRLSPILPFNLLNYALGITRVRLRDYVLASFLGMLPGTFLYVYVGSAVTNASELVSGAHARAGASGQILFWGGLVATLAATILVTRAARKALSRALDEGKARGGFSATGEARS